MCSITGFPAMGTIGFGRRIVKGRSLDPSPPAITTAFIEASLPDITNMETAQHVPRRPICSYISIVQHKEKRSQYYFSASLTRRVDAKRRWLAGQKVDYQLLKVFT